MLARFCCDLQVDLNRTDQTLVAVDMFDSTLSHKHGSVQGALIANATSQA